MKVDLWVNKNDIKLLQKNIKDNNFHSLVKANGILYLDGVDISTPKFKGEFTSMTMNRKALSRKEIEKLMVSHKEGE